MHFIVDIINSKNKMTKSCDLYVSVIIKFSCIIISIKCNQNNGMLDRLMCISGYYIAIQRNLDKELPTEREFGKLMVTL